MALKDNQVIVLYQTDGMRDGEYHSIKEAYQALKDCKRQDKEYDAHLNYWFELETEYGDLLYVDNIKIYKYKNTYRLKVIGNIYSSNRYEYYS